MLVRCTANGLGRVGAYGATDPIAPLDGLAASLRESARRAGGRRRMLMFTAVRTMLLGLVVVAALVLGVASAGAATNLVQNPSFTDDCSGVPCHWTAVVLQETISRDTVTFHTAPASLASTVPAEPFSTTGEIHSDCFTVSPSTAYNFGGSYRT